MGITDNYLAWQFDRTVEIYGQRVDDLLKETKEVSAPKPPQKKGYFKTKPKYTLKKALVVATRLKQKHSQAQQDFARMLESGVMSMVD